MRFRCVLLRVVGSVAVVLAPPVALLYVGAGWLMPATPDHPASDLGDLPIELWPVILVLPLICWVVGLRAIWR